MKLRWKKFEKALRSRTSIHDFSRRMSFWQKINHFLNSSPDVPLWLGRILLSLFLAALALLNTDSIVAHPDVWMAGAALWGLLVTVWQASLIRTTAQIDPVYRTLRMLPLPSESIFRYLLGRILSGSVWLFLELLLVYGVLAASSQQHLVHFASAIVCAALQAVCSGILTLLLVAVEFEPERILLPLLILGAVFVIFCGFSQNETLFAATMHLCNPLGWINGMYLEGWVRGNGHAWWGLLPLLALFTTLPFSLKSVRRLNHDGASRVFQPRRSNLRFVGEEEDVPRVRDEAEERRQIMSGDFLMPRAWNRIGLAERLLARILSPHEQVIAEMFLSGVPRWSRLFFGLIACCVLFLAAGTQIPIWTLDQFAMAIVRFDRTNAVSLAACMASVALFAMMCLKTLSLFCWFAWPEWPLRDSRQTVGPTHRTFRLFPVNYWEADKVIAKINSLIFLLLVPLAMISSFTPLCQMVLKSSGHGNILLPKCLALMWSGSLLLSSLNLTPTFEDLLKYWRWCLKICLIFLASCVVGVGWLFSPSLMLDSALGAILILLTVGWFAYCGAQYCTGSSGRTRS